MVCSLWEDNLKSNLWSFENWMEGGLNTRGLDSIAMEKMAGLSWGVSDLFLTG